MIKEISVALLVLALSVILIRDYIHITRGLKKSKEEGLIKEDNE